MYEVKIIADSINPWGSRLTSVQLTYPRFIHAEALRHRSFSRSVASSRAIPTERFRTLVTENPAGFVWWGKNQPGMQAYEELEGHERERAEDEWKFALDDMLSRHGHLQRLGVHKQNANRLLENWFWLTELVSGTDEAWSNFFHLRCHYAAMPELRHVAFMAADAYFAATPEKLDLGEWHLPYVSKGDRYRYPNETVVKISIACCAKLSYLTQENKAEQEALLTLYARLCNPNYPELRDPDTPVHGSPSEHVARVYDPLDRGALYLCGNFARGWAQHRKEIEGENCEYFTREDLERRRADITARFGKP